MADKNLTMTLGGLTCRIEGYEDPMPILVSIVDYLRSLDAELDGSALVDSLPEGVTLRKAGGQLHVLSAAEAQAIVPQTTNTRPASEFGAPEHLTAAALRPRFLNEDEITSLSSENTGESPVAAGADPVMVLQPEQRAEQPRPPQRAEPERKTYLGRSGPAPLILAPRNRVDQSVVFRRGLSSQPGLMPHEAEVTDLSPTRLAQTPLPEFLARAGAVTLQDRLEAAAVHATRLEGREAVSRGFLLKAVGHDDDSADDFGEALRAFGLLLKEGRLVKADFGRFRVSGASRFIITDLPEMAEG